MMISFVGEEKIGLFSIVPMPIVAQIGYISIMMKSILRHKCYQYHKHTPLQLAIKIVMEISIPPVCRSADKLRRKKSFSMKGPPMPIPSITRRPFINSGRTTHITSGSFRRTTGCTWTAINKTEI